MEAGEGVEADPELSNGFEANGFETTTEDLHLQRIKQDAEEQRKKVKEIL
jgi:hypothetical protein